MPWSIAIKSRKLKSVFQKILAQTESALPNVRTYNTIVKGFAVDGALDEAKRLTKHMKEHKMYGISSLPIRLSV
jgi:pentatricopeptide repeat protein